MTYTAIPRHGFGRSDGNLNRRRMTSRESFAGNIYSISSIAGGASWQRHSFQASTTLGDSTFSDTAHQAALAPESIASRIRTTMCSAQVTARVG